jgi:hypothetical protein
MPKWYGLQGLIIIIIGMGMHACLLDLWHRQAAVDVISL